MVAHLEHHTVTHDGQQRAHRRIDQTPGGRSLRPVFHGSTSRRGDRRRTPPSHGRATHRRTDTDRPSKRGTVSGSVASVDPPTWSDCGVGFPREPDPAPRPVVRAVRTTGIYCRPGCSARPL
ncbi:MAG: hypothetical protein KDB31_06950, partial [Microthrixaceae bacterium]|nr:hypothetical protein [Microthrixaceae bacterium]